MNIETPARVSSRSGKHGSVRFDMSETQSSNDCMLDEIVPMAVRYDEVCNKNVRTLTFKFFRKFHPLLGEMR